jgi:radical SAM protein with 4Fe4S-binding SPASM domain
MERNLLGLPKALRLVWLQTFLGNLNTQAAAPRNPLPRSVVFELAGTCNFRCIGCEAGRGGIDASRFMPAASLRRWAEETARDAQHIRINGMGEATLHPALKECLDILAGFPGGREIITNLSAPIGVYEDLLDRGYVILVSWDGCTRDTFEGIRRGADFGSMVEKLPLLTRVADRTGAPDPPLLFTIRPENILELSGTVSLAARAGVRRIIVNTFKDGTGSDWVSSRSADIREAFAGASVRALAEGVSLALPDHIGKEPFLSDDAYACSAGGCTFPSTQAVVRWNGDVTPCNMLNPYLYGNIEERGFEGCWNGPEARTFRTMTENHPYCEDCYYVDVTRRRRYADTPLARLQNHTPV